MVRRSVLALIAIWSAIVADPSQTAAAGREKRMEPNAFREMQARTLDSLFQQLKAAPNEEMGQAVAKAIWQTWMQSGDIEVDFLMKQAQLALGEGGVEEAFGALDSAIERAPNYAEAWNQRATLNYATGRHAESVRDIMKTLELEPRHFGALAGLGLIYIARENWSAALKAFGKAIEINPWLKERATIIPELERKAAGRPL